MARDNGNHIGGGGDGELDRLAAAIRNDLRAGEVATLERLGRYRAAGVGLLRAKELCKHGAWGRWLAEHCGLSERQAQKYMRFAKSAFKADSDEEEVSWRHVSGSVPRASEGRAPVAPPAGVMPPDPPPPQPLFTARSTRDASPDRNQEDRGGRDAELYDSVPSNPAPPKRPPVMPALTVDGDDGGETDQHEAATDTPAPEVAPPFVPDEVHLAFRTPDDRGRFRSRVAHLKRTHRIDTDTDFFIAAVDRWYGEEVAHA